MFSQILIKNNGNNFMKIFPTIDIKDKKYVRLKKGDFDKKIDYEISPIVQAENSDKLRFKIIDNFISILI